MEVELTQEEIITQTDGNIVQENQTSATTNSKPDSAIEEDIVEKGSNFLEGLLTILSNPESTQRLLSNITETGKKTGQTYLKIPISNTGVVENALKVLSGRAIWRDGQIEVDLKGFSDQTTAIPNELLQFNKHL